MDIEQAELDFVSYERPFQSILEYQTGFILKVDVEHQAHAISSLDSVYRLEKKPYDIFFSLEERETIISLMKEYYPKLKDTYSREKLFLRIALDRSTKRKGKTVTLYSEPCSEKKEFLNHIERITSVSVLGIQFLN